MAFETTLSYTRARALFPSDVAGGEGGGEGEDCAPSRRKFPTNENVGGYFSVRRHWRAVGASTSRILRFAPLRATRKNFDKPRVAPMRCYRDRKEFWVGRFPEGDTAPRVSLARSLSFFCRACARAKSIAEICLFRRCARGRAIRIEGAVENKLGYPDFWKVDVTPKSSSRLNFKRFVCVERVHAPSPRATAQLELSAGKGREG